MHSFSRLPDITPHQHHTPNWRNRRPPQPTTSPANPYTQNGWPKKFTIKEHLNTNTAPISTKISKTYLSYELSHVKVLPTLHNDLQQYILPHALITKGKATPRKQKLTEKKLSPTENIATPPPMHRLRRTTVAVIKQPQAALTTITPLQLAILEKAGITNDRHQRRT
jgi:hypothetical protein